MQNLFLNITYLLGRIFFSEDSKNFERPYLKNWKSEHWFFVRFRTLCNFLDKNNWLFFRGNEGSTCSYIGKSLLDFHIKPLGFEDIYMRFGSLLLLKKMTRRPEKINICVYICILLRFLSRLNCEHTIHTRFIILVNILRDTRPGDSNYIYYFWIQMSKFSYYLMQRD